MDSELAATGTFSDGISNSSEQFFISYEHCFESYEPQPNVECKTKAETLEFYENNTVAIEFYEKKTLIDFSKIDDYKTS